MATLNNHSCGRAGGLVAGGGLLLVGLVCLTGCDRNVSSNPAVSTEPRLPDGCLARVGDVVISRDVFEQEWARRGQRPDKQALLEELIDSAAILSQAKAAGYDRDPDVVARINRLIVAGFQEDQLAKRNAAAAPVDDAAVTGFYQHSPERFTSAETVRAAVIFVNCPRRATEEKRAERRKKAESLLAEARETDARAFTLLAGRHSDHQATRYLGGDTGWIQRGGGTLRWPAGVVEAAWSLSRPGDVAPLVAEADGFYVVRLTERRPAAVRPLEEVREAIRYQLTQEQKHRLEQDFLEDMKRDVRIDINAALLKSLSSRVQTDEQPPPNLPRS